MMMHCGTGRWTSNPGEVGRLQPEFAKRGVKVLALSSNGVESHQEWIADIEAYTPNSKVLLWRSDASSPLHVVAAGCAYLCQHRRL